MGKESDGADLLARLLAQIADASEDEIFDTLWMLVPEEKLIGIALRVLTEAGLAPDAVSLMISSSNTDLHGEEWLLEQELVRQALDSPYGRAALKGLSEDTFNELRIEYGFRGGSSKYDRPAEARRIIRPVIRRLGWAYYVTGGFTGGSDDWIGSSRRTVKPLAKVRFMQLVSEQHENWIEDMDPDQRAAVSAYSPYHFIGNYAFASRPRSDRIILNLREAGEEYLLLRYFAYCQAVRAQQAE
jgi:hypothetical protein